MPTVPAKGEKFNQQFELLEELGSGGVSTVFKARQLSADRLVALKILHSAENSNDKFKERFLNEVKAWSGFTHGSLPRIFEYGESDQGMAFAAMEYIEGKSLRKVLKGEERLASLRAIKIASDVALIMQLLHEAGILHRDLKTDNIILLDSPQPDTVKVVDPAFAFLDEADNFVRAETLIGSPRYVSPEQAGRKPAEARSDIYSLTVCFYEMLTGEKPFSANNSALLLYKHLNEPIPQIQPGQIDRFAPAVNDLVARGMAKKPGDRFQSMKELAEALGSLKAELEKVKPIAVVKTSVPAGSQKGSPTMAIAGVVLMILLALVGTAIFMKPHSVKTEAEFGKIKSEHKKNTIAFLQSDIKRLERKKSSQKLDEYLHNVTLRLRDLADAQRDSGDLAGAEKSIAQAFKLLNDNAGSYSNPDTLARLNGELALIKVQSKEYKGAQAVLSEAEAALKKPSPDTVDRREASLIPARLELNIRLHKFDQASKDLAAIFEFGRTGGKDKADTPPALATAKASWEVFSSEPLKDAQEKLAALSFVDTVLENLLDADRDICKAPSETARNLLSSIPADTPGYKQTAERTQALLARYSAPPPEKKQ